MFVGGHLPCCRPKNMGSVSMPLYSATRDSGPMIWTQPPFIPGLTRLNSVKESSPFCSSQRSPEMGSKAMPNVLRIP